MSRSLAFVSTKNDIPKKFYMLLQFFLLRNRNMNTDQEKIKSQLMKPIPRI